MFSSGLPVGQAHAEHSVQYEQAVTPVPDPNNWFHARIVVANPKVSVLVEDARGPSLVVNQLSDCRNSPIGLWAVGSPSAEFANLRVEPA